MMNKETNWNTEASKAADYIGEKMLAAHRGAILWHNGIVIAFGNDDFECERTKLVVEYLRARLADTEDAPVELGFGVDSESGYTWVMILRCAVNQHATVKWVNATVWAGWLSVFESINADRFEIGHAPDVGGIQGNIAAAEIEREQPIASMASSLKNMTVTNEQFQHGQAWAASQDDPRLQYLATLKQGDPLRVWGVGDGMHFDCIYLGLRPEVEHPVLVKCGDVVFDIDTRAILKPEADVVQNQSPSGETLCIGQPLTQAEHERICNCNHKWVVYSTANVEGWLMVECFYCRAQGTIDPSEAEWMDFLEHPSAPYVWLDKSRVTIRGGLPNAYRNAPPIYEWFGNGFDS